MADSSTTSLIGYARVSTEDQQMSLQRDALLAAGVAERSIYEDTMSGAKKDRPGLQAAIKALRKGDTLVVWKVDRLGRDLSQVLAVLDTIHQKDANLLVITTQMDTRTPTGKMLFSILATLADWERALIRERTRAGLIAARERGRVGGRKVRFTEEVKTRVRELRAQGLLPKDVQERLKAEKLRFALSTIQTYYRELNKDGQ